MKTPRTHAGKMRGKNVREDSLSFVRIVSVFICVFILYNLLAVGALYFFFSASEIINWLLLIAFFILSLFSFKMGFRIESFALMIMLFCNWILFNVAYPTEIRSCLFKVEEKTLSVDQLEKTDKISFIKCPKGLAVLNEGMSDFNESHSNEGSASGASNIFVVPFVEDTNGVTNARERKVFIAERQATSLPVELGFKQSSLFKFDYSNGVQGIVLERGSMDYNLYKEVLEQNRKKISITPEPIIIQWLPSINEYYEKYSYFVWQILGIEIIAWFIIALIARGFHRKRIPFL
jgi:hypothetical protein